MSYRFEKEEGNIKALVIDGWEKGIADSPYEGIASIKNLNVTYLPGATYVNYKRLPVTLSGSMKAPKFYTQSPGTSPTYYMLDDAGQVWQCSSFPATWSLLTGNHTDTGSRGLGYGIAYFNNYLFVFGPNYVEVCGDGTGVGGITSSNWASVNSSGYYFKNLTGVSLTAAPISPTNKIFTAAPAAGAVSGTLTIAWAGTTGVYSAYFSDGEVRSATLTNSSAAVTWTVALTNAVTTAVTFRSPSLTLSATWPYPSGVYQVIVGGGSQTVQGTFVFGSTNISIVPGITVSTATTTISINMFTATSPLNHMAIVAINDVLYFCNGNTIGSITVPPNNPAATFLVSDFTTQYVNYVALQMRNTDRAVWLTELSENLLIAVQNFIYTWDKTTTLVNGFPTQVFGGFPMNENPSRMINILNTVYIFAGQKGNIYISNGYSVSLFKKIPDSFIPALDPSWIIGGLMFHRNKLFFGAVGSSQSNNTSAKVQGIFSLVLGSGISTSSVETTGAINFEAQLSYGISPTTAADGVGVLIDGNFAAGSGLSSGVSNDVYVSAYFNNSAGGIDYNDGTLWANYEPAIETDLIPCGTFFQQRVFENVEYKLDEPLASGDSIRLSYRTSFSASYTAVGAGAVTGGAGVTTATSDASTQVLSDSFISNVTNAQWVQFLIEFKCAASGSSFIRLREMRIH